MFEKAAMKTISRIFEDDYEVIAVFERTIIHDTENEDDFKAYLSNPIIGSDNNVNFLARRVRDHRERLKISLKLSKEKNTISPGLPKHESEALDYATKEFDKALRELALHRALDGMPGFKDFMFHYLRAKTVIGFK